MGDYFPLYLSLILLFVFGFVYPSVMTNLVEIEEVEVSPNFQGTIDRIDNGYDIDLLILDFDINPYAWFGQNVRDYLKDTIRAMSILPAYLIFPITIMIIFGFLYTFIKLLPTT